MIEITNKVSLNDMAGWRSSCAKSLEMFGISDLRVSLGQEENILLPCYRHSGPLKAMHKSQEAARMQLKIFFTKDFFSHYCIMGNFFSL